MKGPMNLAHVILSRSGVSDMLVQMHAAEAKNLRASKGAHSHSSAQILLFAQNDIDIKITVAK